MESSAGIIIWPSDLDQSLRKSCADVINDGWNYSWNWPDDWQPKAFIDCNTRIDRVEIELVKLNSFEINSRVIWM